MPKNDYARRDRRGAWKRKGAKACSLELHGLRAGYSFAACVALKQVMAAKKKPSTRRIRNGVKLRAIAFLATGIAAANTALFAEPAVSIVSDQAGTLKDDQIQPIRRLDTSIAPPAGELPPDSALLRFGEAPVIEASSLTGRDWLNYAYFWQASALCHGPIYLEERIWNAQDCAFAMDCNRRFQPLTSLPVYRHFL